MNSLSASPKIAFLLLSLVMTASCSGKDVGSAQTPASGDSGTPKGDGGGAPTGSGGNGQNTGGRGAGGAQGGSAGSQGGGGAQSTGGSAGSGVCTVDSDCSPAACGQCPDGSTACPKTRCSWGFSGSGSGYCSTFPAECPQCIVDADCPLPACALCIDGSTVCSEQKCLNGSCGGQVIAVCGNQSGPDCTSGSQCPGPVCQTCPDGSKVCTSAGCTNGRCHADSAQCPQCKADSDCGKPLCNVCYDGTTACGSATCQQGQCVNNPPKCPERPTGRPLLWHSTCGYPLCPLPSNPDAGGRDAAVSCAAEGAPCTERGATCGDPSSNCGSVLVCEDYDPKQGGCPISSAKFKNDIRYLEPGDLERLRDETLKFRLTNYRYKPEFTSDPNAEHLGFIIEDNPQSPAVDQGHDRVDLYGYVSMVVATLQVQQKEIQSLRKQLRALESKRACETKK